jgi:Tfp pilus assembly protein PilF
VGNKSRKEILLDMLETDSQDVFLNYALAMEFLSEQNFPAAESQLQKTLRIEPDYLPCFYQLGQVNEKLNQDVLAIEFYNKGIELANKQGNKKALGELNEALWLLQD